MLLMDPFGLLMKHLILFGDFQLLIKNMSDYLILLQVVLCDYKQRTLVCLA